MNAPLIESNNRPSGMSYKFQRLREKIRQAIETGELQGKLPGERALARRFHVNAKTLSKALTDLAAEGVLDRSIGRGTYVKGSAPASSATTGRWLVLCEPDNEATGVVDALRGECPELQTLSPDEPVRPSFLNQFTAVVDLSPATPEAVLRNLLVRNMPVVAVNREPAAYSLNAVLVDGALGVTRLGRDLILAGHRRLGAVEPRGSAVVAHALRNVAGRFAPDAVVDVAEPRDVATLVEEGVTALVCATARAARAARAALEARGIGVPGQVSLTAVGYACQPIPCSGYFVECSQVAQSVIGLLKDVPIRPVALWLAGKWTDHATMTPVATPLHMNPITNHPGAGVVV